MRSPGKSAESGKKCCTRLEHSAHVEGLRSVDCLLRCATKMPQPSRMSGRAGRPVSIPRGMDDRLLTIDLCANAFFAAAATCREVPGAAFQNTRFDRRLQAAEPSGDAAEAVRTAAFSRQRHRGKWRASWRRRDGARSATEWCDRARHAFGTEFCRSAPRDWTQDRGQPETTAMAQRQRARSAASLSWSKRQSSRTTEERT